MEFKEAQDLIEEFVLDRQSKLNDWEITFITNLLEGQPYWVLSEKQETKLNQIVEKVSD